MRMQSASQKTSLSRIPKHARSFGGCRPILPTRTCRRCFIGRRTAIPVTISKTTISRLTSTPSTTTRSLTIKPVWSWGLCLGLRRSSWTKPLQTYSERYPWSHSTPREDSRGSRVTEEGRTVGLLPSSSQNAGLGEDDQIEHVEQRQDVHDDLHHRP